MADRVLAPDGPTLALLRFDRAGRLLWADALRGALEAMTLTDGVGRSFLLVTASETFAVRGLALALTGGPRLLRVELDDDGDVVRARDFGAMPGLLDEAIADDDGGLRVRSSVELRAFAADGVRRWAWTLPAGSGAKFRRDGTTWLATSDCEHLGPGPALTSAHHDCCLTSLDIDGSPSWQHRLWLSDIVFTNAGGENFLFDARLDGGVDLRVILHHVGGLCGDTASELDRSTPYDTLRLSARGSVETSLTDLPSPDGAPCALSVERDARVWQGTLRCRRPCALRGSCEPLPDFTTSAHDCGARGRDCDAAPERTRRRCEDARCVFAGCAETWADCNGDPADGCEAHLADSATHCGACGNRCDGTCTDGRCCIGGCASEVFASDGHEGAFAPSTDVTLPAGVHHFTRITVPVGVTVRGGVGGLLDLRATGDVEIDGTIDLTGGDGAHHRGGCTGQRATVGEGMVGAGPGGGGEGYVGGPGLGPAHGLAGTPDGECSIHPTCERTDTIGHAGQRLYDGVLLFSGGGHSYCSPGLGCSRFACSGSPAGGGSIGARALHDLAVASTFEPGSGGGGGTLLAVSEFAVSSGGGGGGGGGALRIASRTGIFVGPTGALLAEGGDGQLWDDDPNPVGAIHPGGAGSGGVIYLAAPKLDVQPGARVSALGGSGGLDSTTGGLGRIRLSVDPEQCRLDGSFQPPLVDRCHPTPPPGVRCGVYVGAWPW